MRSRILSIAACLILSSLAPISGEAMALDDAKL